ncbi:glutamate receptor-like [Haliotis rufescens]|uniref:glutamate receptor-like n=1 Tax=Haliotis rufescens TaxID=6454 RepID=UPI00201F9FEB|nr:glutamate receptor-like [Haliotis rufescens]XP_046328738.2 glutamate receptor-like [Haliotis rufescens]
MSTLSFVCYIIMTSVTMNAVCGEHHEVVTLLEPPFVMEKTTQPPSDTKKYEGMLIDILDELARRLHFTYNIRVVYDGKFGYEVEPGKWNGLVSELINNNSDLALSHLTINSQRAKVVKFTQPFMLAGLRILYRPPDPWTNQQPWYIMLTPFTAGLWVVIFVLWLVIGCLSYAIDRFSPFEDNLGQRSNDVECRGLPCGKLYTLCCILVQRNHINSPRSPSGRFLASVWWLFCILILITFTASLTAIFLSRDTVINGIPFHSFDELSRQTQVQYGVFKPSLTLDYFKNSEKPMVQRMWQAMNSFHPSVFITSTKQGLDRLRQGNGNFAFIMEGPLAEFEAEKEPCDLVVLGTHMDEQAYGFACRWEGNLCDRIDHKLLEMREDEFLYKVKVKWMYSGCKERRQQEVFSGGLSYLDTFGLRLGGTAAKSVTLRTFGAGFLVLFVGLAVTILILGAEVTYARSRKVTTKFPVHQPMRDEGRDPICGISTNKLMNDDSLS